MRTSAASLFFFLIVLTCFSQPVLNSTDVIPTIGESFDFRVFDADSLPDPDTGANQTWDYSFLLPTGKSSIFVNSPINFPNGKDYPDANLVLEQDSTYLYYKGSNSRFSLYGFEAATNQAIYSNPDDQLRFPLTFQSSGVDTFAGTFDVAVPNLGQFISYRKGVTNFKADGYGTLVLPNGSFNDVLKVTITSIQEDSIRLIIFDTIINSTVTVHQWLEKGTHTPLLTLSKTVSEIPLLTVSLGNYYDRIVGIDDLKKEAMDFRLTYAPEGRKAKLKYKVDASGHVKISVVDLQGREILVLQNGMVQKGRHELNIPFENLCKGIYLLQGSFDNSIQSAKLLVP